MRSRFNEETAAARKVALAVQSAILGKEHIVERRRVVLEDGGIMCYYSSGDIRIAMEIGGDGEAAYIKGEPGKEPEIRDIDTTNLEAELKALFGL